MNNAVKIIGKVALVSLFAASEAAYSGSIATVMDSAHPERTFSRIFSDAKACDSYTNTLTKQINQTYFNTGTGSTISTSCVDDKTGKVTKSEVCNSSAKINFLVKDDTGNVRDVETPVLTCKPM